MRSTRILGLVAALTVIGMGQTWVTRYDGPASDEDVPYGLASDNSGVYVTGASWGTGMSDDFLTVKYGTAGESLWARRYDGAAQAEDGARAIAVRGDRVFVAGGTTASGILTDVCTIAYGTDGSDAWTAVEDGPGASNDMALAVCADNGGNACVAGYATGAGTGWDYIVLKYDPSGNRLWTGRYSTADEDYAVAVAADADGNVCATGCTGSPYTLNWDYLTAKFSSATGETLWTRRLNGSANADDQARAIAIDGTGNVYVTGGTLSTTTNEDFTTVKYGPNGESLWVAFYDGPASGVDWANALALDDAGNVYVTGYSQDTVNDFDFATVKYNSGGGQEWVARYDGPAHSYDEARAICVEHDGSAVYVTGGSTGAGTRSDFATVVYDASGGEVTSYRYDGPASRIDQAERICLGPGGSLYLTGGSAGSGTGTDYATLRYPSVGVSEERTTPDAGGLTLEAAPNPVRDDVTVGYYLPRAGQVTARVCDATGRTVARFAAGRQAAGRHSCVLAGLGPGVYVVRLNVECGRAGSFEQAAKVVVTR